MIPELDEIKERCKSSDRFSKENFNQAILDRQRLLNTLERAVMQRDSVTKRFYHNSSDLAIQAKYHDDDHLRQFIMGYK